MASSLLNPANNPSERHHIIKRKLERDNKNCERLGIKYQIATGFLSIQTLKVI